MGYKLKVIDLTFDDTGQYEWFQTFLNRTRVDGTYYHIDDLLKPWGAKNLINTEYIEFETEAHAALFLLRWS